MVVREEVPGVAVLAVVLAHGAPLSFTEVRPPLFPGGLLLAGLVQSDMFSGHGTPLKCSFESARQQSADQVARASNEKPESLA